MANITIIDENDAISDSRSDINQNFANLNSDKIETSVIDTDTAMSANSDSKIPSQKAVKTYIDTVGGANASESVRGVVEEATQTEVDNYTAQGATGARLYVNPSKLETIGKGGSRLVESDTTISNISSATVDIIDETIEGGTLGTNAVIRVNLNLSVGASGNAYLSFIYGATTLVSNYDINAAFGGAGVARIELLLMADASASAQKAHLYLFGFTDNSTTVLKIKSTTGATATEDSTADKSLKVRLQAVGAQSINVAYVFVERILN